MIRRIVFPVVMVISILASSVPASAQPCLIFVHGKQTDTNTYTNYASARAYWQNGSLDAIRTATKNFAASYYVVGYNGTRPYYETQSAGEVANEIVNATNGGADGGGRRCTRTYAQGGTFWVVAHSMGGTIMDFILGNNDTSDPNYNFSGPFNTVATRISLAITLGGAHRGSEGADAVCGESSGGCNWAAQWIQSCDDATYWLRSDDAVQVRSFSNAPAKNVWLTGGYEAIFGASVCLSGEDDGIVQHASQYACSGNAHTGYNNNNVCSNTAKQESSGFKNLDTGHENHSDERDDSDSDTRRAIPTGIWICGSSPCTPDTVVQSSMTSARLVSVLY